MAKYKIIEGYDLVQEITKALDLKHTRRIIIDISLDSVVTLYVEFLGDERLYDIDFTVMKLEVSEDE